jgi:hypothetical protein
MPDQSETMSVADIMKEYGISRMTVHRRIEKGVLIPINVSPALYRQHKLLFYRKDVAQALNKNKEIIAA